MTISTRMMFVFALVFAAGTGAAMYLGVQLGLAADRHEPASTLLAEPIARTYAPLAEPVADADGPAELCVEEAAVDTETNPSNESSSGGESGDFATNSGTISGSQFSDGGFGDIGQQWWNVDVSGDVITVNVAQGGSSTVVTGDDVVIDGTGSPNPASVGTSGAPLAAGPTAPSGSEDPGPPAATQVTAPPSAAPSQTSPTVPVTTAPATVEALDG